MQAALQRGPVQQPGQAVVVRRPGQAVLPHPALLDVPLVQHDAADGRVGAQVLRGELVPAVAPVALPHPDLHAVHLLRAQLQPPLQPGHEREVLRVHQVGVAGAQQALDGPADQRRGCAVRRQHHRVRVHHERQVVGVLHERAEPSVQAHRPPGLHLAGLRVLPDAHDRHQRHQQGPQGGGVGRRVRQRARQHPAGDQRLQRHRVPGGQRGGRAPHPRPGPVDVHRAHEHPGRWEQVGHAGAAHARREARRAQPARRQDRPRGRRTAAHQALRGLLGEDQGHDQPEAARPRRPLARPRARIAG